ncbi:MAG: RNA polymerase sigma factor [Solirubrobacteraceae bacterium]
MAGLLATALLRTQDDERLAALASAGHAGAFDVLVSRHARTLHAVARRVAGPDAADDVTQQALLRAWTAISAGARVRHPSGWLHRIVRTTAIDARHAMPDDTELPDDVAADLDLPAEVQQRIDVRHALALLAALPEEQRAAVLAAVQGRSSADVADELGVSEGAVRQIAHRARTGLRAAMTAVTPYPLAVWAAQRLTGEGAAVAAEAVGAGGSVLGGALLAKAGATVIVSGSVTPAITAPDTPREDRARSEEPAASAVAPVPPPAPPPTQFAAVSAGVGSAFSADGTPVRSESSRRADRAERQERSQRSTGSDERPDRHRRDDDDAAPATLDERGKGERGRGGRNRGGEDPRGAQPERSGRSDDGATSGSGRGKKQQESVVPEAQEPDGTDASSGGEQTGGGDRGRSGDSVRNEHPAEVTEGVPEVDDTSHRGGSGKHDDD